MEVGGSHHISVRSCEQYSIVEQSVSATRSIDFSLTHWHLRRYHRVTWIAKTSHFYKTRQRDLYKLYS